MIISSQQISSVLKHYLSKVEKKDELFGEHIQGDERGTSRDQLTLSSRARDVQRIREVLGQIPEAREDRIATRSWAEPWLTGFCKRVFV